MKAFDGVAQKKVQAEDGVMQRAPLWRIDPEDLRAAGAFLKVGNVMLGKLLTQVEADHVNFGGVAHGCSSAFLERSSRMLKKSASGVLAALRGSTYQAVRLASSLAAALLGGLFEHPAVYGTLGPDVTLLWHVGKYSSFSAAC